MAAGCAVPAGEGCRPPPWPARASDNSGCVLCAMCSSRKSSPGGGPSTAEEKSKLYLLSSLEMYHGAGRGAVQGAPRRGEVVRAIIMVQRATASPQLRPHNCKITGHRQQRRVAACVYLDTAQMCMLHGQQSHHQSLGQFSQGSQPCSKPRARCAAHHTRLDIIYSPFADCDARRCFAFASSKAKSCVKTFSYSCSTFAPASPLPSM